MAKKQFKAESKRLLDLMINSIYTHQEIFLREIISNASDAIDKLAYQALTDEKVGLNRSDFAIELKPDETARTLTVSDNGVGMDKDEMENNLGTICRSGSLQFKQALDKDKAADTDIIGQFGVGFYSAFMVADKVTVISKKYGSDEAWKWESEGADGYTMTPCERANAGTDVIMQLKADTDDEKYSRFLKTWELQQLVRKYSDYIRYPIRMAVEKSRMKEGTEKNETPEYETYTEVETLNSMVPIWNKNKKDVTDEEYNNFYKEKFFDFEDPLAVIHAKDDSDVDSIHEDLRHQILDCKDVHKVDSSTDSMDFFNHMPRWLGKFLVWILTRLDIHGWIPASIIETDPYYTTCVISNLGSIKLNCGYHHLTNWGTCSVFCIIGEKSKRPVYHEDGTIEMREMLDLGLTIDERLADGYYYSKTIRLLKTLLENPELLETPANQEVAY